MRLLQNEFPETLKFTNNSRALGGHTMTLDFKRAPLTPRHDPYTAVEVPAESTTPAATLRVPPRYALALCPDISSDRCLERSGKH